MFRILKRGSIKASVLGHSQSLRMLSRDAPSQAPTDVCLLCAGLWNGIWDSERHHRSTVLSCTPETDKGKQAHASQLDLRKKVPQFSYPKRQKLCVHSPNKYPHTSAFNDQDDPIYELLNLCFLKSSAFSCLKEHVYCLIRLGISAEVVLNNTGFSIFSTYVTQPPFSGVSNQRCKDLFMHSRF